MKHVHWKSTRKNEKNTPASRLAADLQYWEYVIAFCLTCRIPNSTAKTQSPYSIDRYIIDIYEIRRQGNINVMVIIGKERVTMIIFRMITMLYLSNTYCCEHIQCGKTRIRLTLVLMNLESCKHKHDMRSHTRWIMFRSGWSWLWEEQVKWSSNDVTPLIPSTICWIATDVCVMSYYIGCRRHWMRSREPSLDFRFAPSRTENTCSGKM